MTRTRGLAAGLLALALLFTAGCAADSSDTSDHQLVIGASAAPDSLDPTTADAAAIPEALLYNVYETLVKVNDDGELVGLLASSWDVSDDRTQYTFHLNEAQFSNGNPVNADAVAYSFDRIKKDDAVLPARKKPMDVVSEVTAIDDHTVQVTLARPSNRWLFAISQPTGIIIDPQDSADLATNPVGSGPFVYDSQVQGSSLTLKRNDNYWGTPTSLAGATFKYYADANAENSAMLSGELDVISNVPNPHGLEQFGNDRFTVTEGTSTGEVVLGMNHQREALQDVRVRQAILYAIDFKELRDAVWAGKGALIGSMVPPTDPWYEDLSGTYPYDPAKARELLAEAGVSGLSLSMRIPTLPYAPDSANYIASQLREVGIECNVEELEFPATWISEVMQKSNYDLTIISHFEARDIVNFANPDYYWHYDNPEFADLVARADAADPEESNELMKQAARILADDAAAGFLWLFPHLVVTKNNVHGVGENATSLSFDITTVTVG